MQKFPTIMPRFYTIASSSLANPKDLAIAISLTQMPLADGTIKLGLTSKYFVNLKKLLDQNNCQTSEKVIVKGFIKPSAFMLAPETTPIIMIGPGTGVVPFIGFL